MSIIKIVEGCGSIVLCCVLSMGCEPEDSSDEAGQGSSGGAEIGDSSDDGATPPVQPDPGSDAIEGDVILRNRVALDMPVLIRLLADEVELDCEAVEADPVMTLPSDVFAEGVLHTLSPHEMIAVWPHEPEERACYAAWVETEGLGVRLLLWYEGDPSITRYANSCCDIGQGVVELIPVDGGQALDLLGNTWLVHDPSE